MHGPSTAAVDEVESSWDEDDQPVAAADNASREAAGTAIDVLTAIRDTIDENVQRLGDIDAVAGDGDHGIGMQRGARAAVEAASAERDRGAGAGAVLIAGADAWADRAGGTSGALWGVALRAIGDAIGNDAQTRRRKMSATASPRRCATFSRSAKPTSATRRSSTCWPRPAPP